jgi:MFS family permease
MATQPSTHAGPVTLVPWYRQLTGYHWWVLAIASMGWLFDTMDQRLFVLSRGPAMTALLPAGTPASDITFYSSIATAVFMLGWAIGGFYCGILADRWGRAKTMMLTILVYSAFTGLSALSTNAWDFMLYRFLTGLGVGGEFAAGVTLVAEVLPLGWRWMFLVGVLPSLLVVAVFRKMKEPEKWLKARAAVARGDHKQMGSMKDLWTHPRWRRNTIIGLLLAISGVVGLWGIGFWTPELIREALKDSPAADRNWYVSLGTLLQDVGAFFGVFAFTFMTSRVGRRPAFIGAFLISMAATLLAFGRLRTPNDIFWMIPLLGFCTLTVFGGYSIYFPELYPTRLRSSGVGFCYNVGRIIAALGPFTLGSLTVLFKDAGFGSPFRAAAMSLASIYLLGVAVTLFAPETRGQPLPEE